MIDKISWITIYPEIILSVMACVITRSKGSHHRLVHVADPTRQTTVSVHKGRDIPRGTLRDIIEQAGLTVDEFIALLRRA